MIITKKATDFAHGKRLETWTIQGKGPHGLSVSRDLNVAHITGSAGPGPTLLFTGTIHGDDASLEAKAFPLSTDGCHTVLKTAG